MPACAYLLRSHPFPGGALDSFYAFLPHLLLCILGAWPVPASSHWDCTCLYLLLLCLSLLFCLYFSPCACDLLCMAACCLLGYLWEALGSVPAAAAAAAYLAAEGTGTGELRAMPPATAAVHRALRAYRALKSAPAHGGMEEETRWA